VGVLPATQEPLDAPRGDLVVPGVERVDEIPRLGQPELAIRDGIPAEPAHGRAFVAERIVAPDQEDEAKGVGQIDVSELRRGEREVCVPCLECALKLSVSVALRRARLIGGRASGRADQLHALDPGHALAPIALLAAVRGAVDVSDTGRSSRKRHRRTRDRQGDD
jgi:hypothetical protein